MNRFIVYITLISILAFYTNAASIAQPVCGGTTSSKDIQLLTPTNPPRLCIYHINAYSRSVCQLRIKFTMTLAQPSIPGADNNLKYVKCVNDIFKVGELELCGGETNAHINLPFNSSAGVTNIDLYFALADRSAFANLPTPKWDVSITQLECPSDGLVREMNSIASDDELTAQMRSYIKDAFWIAPPGCLRYYPWASGTVTSFNYNGSQGVYLGNMKYAMCFRRQTDSKTLVLRNYNFYLGSNYSSGKLMQLDNYCYAQYRYLEEQEDYLMVPDAEIKENLIRATYFCGDSINRNTIISTNPGPFMMIFNSDANYTQKEKTFYFSYSIE